MEMTVQKKWYKLVFVFLFVTLPLSSYASREVFIFGGGPTPNASQISIELNTRWIYKLLRNHYSKNQIHTLYTDGNSENLDVHRWQPADDKKEDYQPLARVFNKQRKNRFIYSSSHIADQVFKSDADTVRSQLSNLFTGAKKNDELLLIYQGHGGYEAADTNNNYFRLWSNSRITVTELENLMAQTDPQATIRFVLPQCFSGAFSRLIYKDARLEKGLAEGNRCGFVAQVEDRESEGCTDSVNTGDYRDYAYYFFSALDGKTIDGKLINQTPDLNNNGTVTLREAHLYTLENAFSVDYSFSTSEGYLENWQPWYLKWAPVPVNPDNAYQQIATRIAERFDVLVNDEINLPVIKRRIESLTASVEVKKQQEEMLNAEIKKLQNTIQTQLILRWPAIEFPYTNHYRKLIAEDMEPIQQAILEYPEYSKLVEKQDRLIALKSEVLSQEREMVQMKKIFRMRNLARILAQFEHYATDDAKNAYAKLVQCEETQL
jgi:hypothetical protein